MSTRSTITFNNEYTNKPMVCIYQQYDGYITGAGHELAKFLKAKTLINGIGSRQKMDRYANGMGCLAAQFIAEHKTEIGGLYIAAIGDIEEYNYYVSWKDGIFTIKVDDIFTGTPDGLLAFNEDDDDGDTF